MFLHEHEIKEIFNESKKANITSNDFLLLWTWFDFVSVKKSRSLSILKIAFFPSWTDKTWSHKSSFCKFSQQTSNLNGFWFSWTSVYFAMLKTSQFFLVFDYTLNQLTLKIREPMLSLTNKLSLKVKLLISQISLILTVIYYIKKRSFSFCLLKSSCLLFWRPLKSSLTVFIFLPEFCRYIC